MKAKLGSPLLLLLLAMGSIGWGVGLYRSPSQATAQGPAQTGPEDQQSGADIIRQCRQTLEEVPSLEVNLSQQVAVQGQQLNGNGHYLQQGKGGERTRLYLKFSAGEDSASYLQTNNGRFVYTQIHTPQTHQLTLVDLQQAEKELGRPPVPAIPAAQGATTAGAGLLALIRALERDFEFASAQQITWGNQQVWQLGGRWKSEKLTEYFGLPENAWLDSQTIGQLPAHVPTHVEIVVGLDPQLPFFPYRVVFLKQVDQKGEQEYETLSRLETSEIRQQVDLNPSQFDNVPGEDEVIDVTSQFIAEQRRANP